ncbi:probable WRKY transcription factor 50 [Triticum dicoccoides]|uniref:probable WRKY transcription factor 50 n=1 Tax=Triticum dicoccoides TaxID=85692 RepID=UPI00188E6984|nr:probable WRKY transcription factor 50 [Triticum dicoccoides]
MAAVGAAPLLYQQHAQAAGDGYYFSFMSAYFSNGEASSNASSPASSFSAALGATPAIAADPAAQFDISEYLFDEGAFSAALPPVVSVPAVGATAASSAIAVTARSAESAAAAERPRTERIAFRTRSEVEILDDGYKWRKYGKKSVKNSPNPRNYYRCSTEGCNVKKRVERDRDDPAYVVTTYEGTHSHVSPSTIYYASQDAASGRFFVAGTHPPPGSLL